MPAKYGSTILVDSVPYTIAEAAERLKAKGQPINRHTIMAEADTDYRTADWGMYALMRCGLATRLNTKPPVLYRLHDDWREHTMTREEARKQRRKSVSTETASWQWERTALEEAWPA